MEPTITRYSEPSSFDHAPRGSICKKIRSMSDDFEIWVQVSEKEEEPCWVMAGSYNSDTPDSLIEQDIKASL